MIGQRVSVSEIIGAQIDSETPLVCVADPRDAGRIAVVRIRETAFASVGGHELAKLDSVNRATGRGQIARLIVAPQLTIGQRRDCFAKLAP